MENPVIETAKDLLGFLKSPKDKKDTNKSTSYKFNTLLAVLLIDLVLIICLTPILSLIDRLELFDSKEHEVAKLMETFPWWGVMLLTVLLVPFFEELIFRSWLRFPKRPTVEFDEPPKTWSTLYPYIFYFSAVLFAGVHLSNYPDLDRIIWVAPLLVLPQLIMGVLAGYLRVKQGLRWGFYLHALHNLVFISFSLMSMDSPIKKIEIEKESYRFYLEETDSRDKTSVRSTSNFNDSIAYKNTKLQNILADCLDTAAKFIVIDKNVESKKGINLNIHKYSDTINLKSQILEELGSIYSFTISSTDSVLSAINLEITDPNLLAKQSSKSEDKVKNTYSRKSNMELEYASLVDLVDFMNNNYSEYYVSDDAGPEKYDFEFPRNSPEENFKNFGLSSSPVQIEVKFFKIE